MNTTPKKAIVLLSGGIDSTTCCAIAQQQGFSIHALSFSYGQRHTIELACAENIAKKLNVAEHRIITLDLCAFTSSLTNQQLTVPKNRNEDAMARAIPNTYVPARNTIFLSYALGYAECVHAADIFIGVNAVDYSGYPDCRPEFITAFERMANLATAAGVSGKPLKIHTPLLHLTKADIICAGIQLGVDYSMTHSCYDPSETGRACGHCDSCLLRKKGFARTGVIDPTLYEE